ncbi:MAG: T9SS type A sorting domain-containing protein [Bacteroidetes bacterium]|nr:T9SS type A sorting domain-containing protein [Bacteroidota bacterium]
MKNKSILCLVWLSLIFTKPSTAQDFNDTLDIVTWNLHEFGSDSTIRNQVGNIKTVMDKMNADFYACEEVIQVDSFKKLGQSLNGGFGYNYAHYGGGINVTDTTSPYYPSSLKYGFLYRKSMFRNISVRPLMHGSNTASMNFYGRFPYSIQCEVMGNDSNWYPIHFVIIHAACCPDDNACMRKRKGAQELKDSLDQYYPADRLIVLGDFNDDLDTTICTNGTKSTYAYWLQDTQRYEAITLPFSLKNIGSFIGYSNMIDHMIISDELKPNYVPNSVRIFKSYTWANTSDHYPVVAQFLLPPAATKTPTFALANAVISPNPADKSIKINLPVATEGHYALYDFTGRLVSSQPFQNRKFTIATEQLPIGLYLLQIIADGGVASIQKFQIVH